jgi:hypothetical protein
VHPSGGVDFVATTARVFCIQFYRPTSSEAIVRERGLSSSAQGQKKIVVLEALDRLRDVQTPNEAV